jgi:hypothetical protein
MTGYDNNSIGDEKMTGFKNERVRQTRKRKAQGYESTTGFENESVRG